MANPYHNPSGTPATSSPGSSSPMRGEFALIAAGFAMLPATFPANAAVVVNAGGTGLTTLSGPPIISGGALGTPSSGVLTNATGLPTSALVGVGTGVLSALDTPVSGIGGMVLTSGATLSGATLSTATLGTPNSVTLTNGTGLPISTGLTGAGTGVLTALGNAVNAAGGLTTFGTDLPLAGGTVTGSLAISGTLAVTGTTTFGTSGGFTAGTVAGAPTIVFAGGGNYLQYVSAAGGNILLQTSGAFFVNGNTALASPGGFTPGTYGGAGGALAITIDANGRVTNCKTIAYPAAASGGVTNSGGS